MINTEKKVCRMTAWLLAKFGIRDVVISPGSRNTPLIIAMHREERLRCHVVVDERSAAFLGLGMALASGCGAAIVCTSGSALLNYAPAVAEAYYRHIPLVVISADRPAAWIGQDDSQTIRQPGALSNMVLAECNLRDDIHKTDSTGDWFACRELNHVLLTALFGRRGPVHINVQLSEPLNRQVEVGVGEDNFKKIELIAAPGRISPSQSRDMASELSGKRVLVAGGFHSPDDLLGKALGRIARLPNVAVLVEGTANIHARGVHEAPDRILSGISDEDLAILRPDVLITFGGALVSRRLKEWLRLCSPGEHWHIGENEATIDTFRCLTRRVEIPAAGFFPRLSGAMTHIGSSGAIKDSYSTRWDMLARQACDNSSKFITGAPWSDLIAVNSLLNLLPRTANLQLGNGMSVRYGLLHDLSGFHRVDSNRGVSGIDGCISTAIGAASFYNGMTFLIVGDMSAQYDIGALAAASLSPRLRIIVLNNGGGSIFRTINSTRSLPEREMYLCCPNSISLAEIAEGYGIRYFQAHNLTELKSVSNEFTSDGGGCAILEIFTDGEISADVMRAYMSRSKSI